MEILYEYFVANSEQNILYGSEGVFRVLIVKYSSLLGNIGQYELSNSLADFSYNYTDHKKYGGISIIIYGMIT